MTMGEGGTRKQDNGNEEEGGVSPFSGQRKDLKGWAQQEDSGFLNNLMKLMRRHCHEGSGRGNTGPCDSPERERESTSSGEGDRVLQPSPPALTEAY